MITPPKEERSQVGSPDKVLPLDVVPPPPSNGPSPNTLQTMIAKLNAAPLPPAQKPVKGPTKFPPIIETRVSFGSKGSKII
jgi:hypothetical protein